MKTLQTKFRALAAGAILAAGVVSTANAIPTFTVTPSAIPGSAEAPFIANNILGNSSELLTITSSTTVSGSGWVQMSGFACNANPSCVINGNILPGTSGLQVTYQSYILFTLTDHLVSGTMGAPGSTYALDSLNFSWFIDPGLSDTFQSAAIPSTNATVTDNGAADILIATGTLVPGQGTAGFDSQFGAFLNSTENFFLCNGAGTALNGLNGTVPDPSCTSGVGAAFFSAPRPFFDFAFDGFNCTGGANCATATGTTTGSTIAINDAVGTIDFGSRVPEPASLVLFGSGALLLGWMASRRPKKLLS